VDDARTWITVRGSQAALAKIGEIYLGVIDLSVLTSSTRVTFPIEMPDGVENFSGIYTASYDVEIPVLPILETRFFDVNSSNFELINVPEGVNVSFTSQGCRVWLRGPAEILDQVNAENIRVIVDYAAQDTIKLNNTNALDVYFVILDAEGNEMSGVGAVLPPDVENYAYTVNAYVGAQEEGPAE